jgi:hypothetical protein
VVQVSAFAFEAMREANQGTSGVTICFNQIVTTDTTGNLPQCCRVYSDNVDCCVTYESHWKKKYIPFHFVNDQSKTSRGGLKVINYLLSFIYIISLK